MIINNKSKIDSRDLQPEMFYQINREFVEFDEFQSHKKVANKFKETLCSFENDSKDSFFNVILYGLLFKLSEAIR